MFAAVTLFVLACLTATARADHHHHQPCHAPNMTGFMNVMDVMGGIKAYGAFTYDSMGKKLRFRSNESHPTNASLGLDLLMFFDEGVFYEIDNKNQSCEKKTLHCAMHPLDIPDEASTLYAAPYIGSPTIEGEGLKVNVYTGAMPGSKGRYSMSVTMGCLPISTLYFTGSTTFLFSNMNVELEIKDPDLLTVPSFCLGPLVETPEGTVNSFLHEFM